MEQETMNDNQAAHVAQSLHAIANILKKIEEHLAVIAASQPKPKPQ
jgi:hypothetical protein